LEIKIACNVLIISSHTYGIENLIQCHKYIAEINIIKKNHKRRLDNVNLLRSETMFDILIVSAQDTL
jgi:hypothetical protein